MQALTAIARRIAARGADGAEKAARPLFAGPFVGQRNRRLLALAIIDIGLVVATADLQVGPGCSRTRLRNFGASARRVGPRALSGLILTERTGLALLGDNAAAALAGANRPRAAGREHHQRQRRCERNDEPRFHGCPLPGFQKKQPEVILLVAGLQWFSVQQDKRNTCSSWPGKSAKRVFALDIPAIHAFVSGQGRTWMPATSAGMTGKLSSPARFGDRLNERRP